MDRSYRKIGTYCSIVLLMLASVGKSDIEKDKAECANQLVGLATCLPYVGGQGKTPTADCCTGLSQLLKANKKCLCILVKDKDDPSVGLKINATLALGLPAKCKSPNGDISECPALLHMAPNSPEAKVFTDFSKDAGAEPTTASTPASKATPMDSTAATTTTAKAPVNDGVRNKGFIPQLLCGVFLSTFTFHFVF